VRARYARRIAGLGRAELPRGGDCELPEPRSLNLPHLLFGLRGRIDRIRWCVASLVLIIPLLIVLKLIGWFDFEALSARISRSAALGIGTVLALTLLLIVFCLLALMLKRLHDRNRRGWWLLLFPPVPIVLASSVSAFAEDLGPTLSDALWAVVLMITIGALIDLGGLPGTPGPNQHGPDPFAKASRQGKGERFAERP
jgi:uncharacterized membrane protein YhaH (DUF805 family)